MKTLGKLLTKGLLPGTLGLTGLAGLATVVPPLAYWLAGTPLGLISLRQGWQRSLMIMFATLALVMLILMLSGTQPNDILQFLFGIWVTVLVTALTLRETQSQGMMVTCGVLIAILFVLFMHYSHHDVTQYYRDLFDEVWLKHIQPGLSEQRSAEELSLLKDVVDKMIPLLNGIHASSILFGIVSTVLLARAWQSQLFNPGGFRQEFLKLRLPWIMLMAMVLAAIVVFTQGAIDDSLARDCLMVFVVAYSFQGVATMHAVADHKPSIRPWLVIMYFSLVFITHYAVIILCCIGVADSALSRGNRQGSQ